MLATAWFFFFFFPRKLWGADLASKLVPTLPSSLDLAEASYRPTQSRWMECPTVTLDLHGMSQLPWANDTVRCRTGRPRFLPVGFPCS